MNLLQSLRRWGRSVWLDDFERSWTIGGQLQRYIDNGGIRGVLSNFQSLQAAIEGKKYDRDFNVYSCCTWLLNLLRGHR
ncbi:hypothetical protein QUA56_33015 [Microcoleus sp. N3A4]|uniref:hypothetical protein n=1 Tax=Microcoleus sp. N3A4 TaxID=3055379 RepID=UPI002FD3D145